VLDVSRGAHGDFAYEALEAIKNGIISSGKYRGRTANLKTPKVLVMSNSLPNFEQLSQDRWELINLNNEDTTPTFNPSVLYPFVQPPSFPDLEENSVNARTLITGYKDQQQHPPHAPRFPQQRPPILPPTTQPTATTSQPENFHQLLHPTPSPVRRHFTPPLRPLHSQRSAYGHVGRPSTSGVTFVRERPLDSSE